MSGNAYLKNDPAGAPGPAWSLYRKILAFDLSVFLMGDMITTRIALARGGIEANNGILPIVNPAFLLTAAPWLWYLIMCSGLVIIILLSYMMDEAWRAARGSVSMGLIILIAPVFIEAGAVLNNIGVIRSLLVC